MTRTIDDAELDGFVDGLASRLASFDKPALAAAKAQINRFDILLSANEKPLRQVPDLIAALEEFKEKELKFTDGPED